MGAEYALDPEGPGSRIVLTLMVGGQAIPFTISSELLSYGFYHMVHAVDEWRKADGRMDATYLAIQTALALLMPKIRRDLEANGAPPLPPRERRGDPVLYLANYICGLLPQLAAQTAWVAEADEYGRFFAFHPEQAGTDVDTPSEGADHNDPGTDRRAG